MQPSLTPPAAERLVRTVLAEIPHDRLGITDAHSHAWIDPIPGADPASPVLNDFAILRAALESYRAAGGGAMLDCQPGGCGRNGLRLVELSSQTGIHIIACTGFHRRKYYPAGHWLFAASEQAAADYFIKELTVALEETAGMPAAFPAGFIKLALEAAWDETPQSALRGAAQAALATGAMLEIHTEKGALAEQAVRFFADRGVPPSRVVICHIDKRPDFGLHAELARLGVMLEYDTFFRPKYAPEVHLWPLIEKMTAAGLEGQVALATDTAELEQYKAAGSGPLFAGLPGRISSGLAALGIPAGSIQKMLGGNIARRLAGLA